MSAVSDNIYRLLRSQTPGSTSSIVGAALFETVSEVCRLILQVAPPNDPSSPYGGWLTDAQWLEHHTMIVAGTLARLYTMPGKPWTSDAAAQAQVAYYQMMLPRAREVAAAKSTTDTAFNRLMANLLSAIPGMRNEFIEQEVFNTVDDLTRNYIAGTAPDQTAPAAQWMTEAQWELYYRLIYAGTMYRALSQPGKPWSDVNLSAFYKGQWDELLTFARADAAETFDVDPTARLVSSIKSRLPGAKESQIRLALYDVLQDACQRARLWTEKVPYRLLPNTQVFSVEQSKARIVMLVDVQHPVLTRRDVAYSNGKIAVNVDTATLDLEDYLYLTLALSPSLDVDMDNPQQWIPADLFASKYTLLLNGVLGAMMLQTAKPYSNTQLGQYHTQVFSRELNASPLIDREGGLPARQHWRFPRFA